jgi:prevent-host-death family protein
MQMDVLMSWQVYDAKARLSEFLDASLKQGPQIITKRGVEAAVRISINEWKRLRNSTRPNIKDILLDPNGPYDIDIPPRRRLLFHPVDFDGQA